MHKEFFKKHRTMKKTIEIINGPSREELFDGLRLSAEKRLIPFSITDKFWRNYGGITIKTMIQSIQIEDGSGQSWNISFSVRVGDFTPMFDFKEFFPNEEVSNARKHMTEIMVKAYYSTKTRNGVITME